MAAGWIRLGFGALATLGMVALASGCAEMSEAPVASATAEAQPAPPAAAPPRGPLRLAYVAPSLASSADALFAATARPSDEAIVSVDESGLHDASGEKVDWPKTTGTSAGIFGYALQEATLTTESGEALGRVAADTRVRVVRLKDEGGNERAEVVLPAWTPASGSADEGPLHAWLPARSLAARPIGEPPQPLLPASATSQRRSVPLRDPRWQTLAYTFCGPLDVATPAPASGLARVEQHDGGITLFGFVETGDLEVTNRCPRPVLLREHPADGTAGLTRLVLGGQTRRYDASEPPPGLVPADVHGARLAALVTRKKTVYWVADDGARLHCQAWTFGVTRAGVTALASLQRLENGEELSVALDATLIPATATREETLAISGPVSEVIGKGVTAHRPEHATPRCSRQYRVVGSDPASFILFRGRVYGGATVLAYAPGDAERWFSDKAACDQAVGGDKPAYTAAGFAPHEACE